VPELPGEQARVVLTDEPYNVPNVGHVASQVHHREFAMAAGEMTREEYACVQPHLDVKRSPLSRRRRRHRDVDRLAQRRTEIVLEEAARIAKVKVGDQILHIDKDRASMRKAFDMALQGNVEVLRFVRARLAMAQAAAGAMADPEEPLTEEELAIIELLSKKPAK
jgi:hypothetical protein